MVGAARGNRRRCRCRRRKVPASEGSGTATAESRRVLGWRPHGGRDLVGRCVDDFPVQRVTPGCWPVGASLPAGSGEGDLLVRAAILGCRPQGATASAARCVDDSRAGA